MFSNQKNLDNTLGWHPGDEELDEGTETLLGNGSSYPTLLTEGDTMLSTAKGYESGAVKEDIEKTCASVTMDAVLGETRPSSFYGQDFKEIRSRCLAEGRLFKDPEFPAVDRTLYYKEKPVKGPITWLRPRKIFKDPQLFVDGYSRFDVEQGQLGDCWMLAAVANLTLHREWFLQVVPDDQSFDEDYAGVFHFRFWQHGSWVDVVVDDRLPTQEGNLLFVSSSKKNEFWPALLEKAYAKLHGSYESIVGGTIEEALQDFSGGLTEAYYIPDGDGLPANFFTILLKAYERNSLGGCYIDEVPNTEEYESSTGLITIHEYSITKVKYIETPGGAGKIPLLRLRNPWGDDAEWKGAWSDNSPEWLSIPESEKKEMGLTFDEDGEFWMTYKDFVKHFSYVNFCHLHPNSMNPEEYPECTKKWEMSVCKGEWIRGVSAGGSGDYLNTFWKNPQYILTLKDVDEQDDENKCTIIVALLQKNRRHQGLHLLSITFYIYRLPDNVDVSKPLDYNFFKSNKYVGRYPETTNLREVSARFKLDPGSYVIVPSTSHPNEEGEFLLRVLSEKSSILAENVVYIGKSDVDGRLDETRPSMFLGQDFKGIKSRCLAKGWVFQDPEFLAEDCSLNYDQSLIDGNITWLTPRKICKVRQRPQFYVKGRSRFDVQQGGLDDSWFLAALVSLTLHRKLFHQVVPDGQSFDKDYAGVFHFRFWQYGSWVDVVVDDRLPTYKRKLVFLHSSKNNEFWPALLQKAYAKLHGSYGALKGGSIGEAMEDFTGGVTETYDIGEQPPTKFFTVLLKSYERNSLIGCIIETDPNNKKADSNFPVGLIPRQAYSVTKVKYLEVPGLAEKIPLLRLHNPQKHEAEWDGPWSDKSPEWQSIPKSEKKKMGLTVEHDGEFWMSFTDFVYYFSTVQICNLNPDFFDAKECPEGCTKKWEMSLCKGKWVKGVSAGGCQEYLETFWRNPQYIVTLKDVDEGDDENKCTIIVALTQKNRRYRGLEYLMIGFYIYQLPNNVHVPKPLDYKFFKSSAYVGRTEHFSKLRGVTARFKLDPGSYVIVPSTSHPNEEGEFLLRVFSEKSNNMTEYNVDIGKSDINDRVNEIYPKPGPDNWLAGEIGVAEEIEEDEEENGEEEKGEGKEGEKDGEGML